MAMIPCLFSWIAAFFLLIWYWPSYQAYENIVNVPNASTDPGVYLHHTSMFCADRLGVAISYLASTEFSCLAQTMLNTTSVKRWACVCDLCSVLGKHSTQLHGYFGLRFIELQVLLGVLFWIRCCAHHHQ